MEPITKFDHKKVSDIKQALKEHSEFYPGSPKDIHVLDRLCFKYAQVLSSYPVDSVLNALNTLANNAGRYFPTLVEIKEKLGNQSLRAVDGCIHCDGTGMIHCVHNSSKEGYAFRCRCDKGNSLSHSCPRWDRNKYADMYTPFKDIVRPKALIK